jgi:hypothetical protein
MKRATRRHLEMGWLDGWTDGWMGRVIEKDAGGKGSFHGNGGIVHWPHPIMTAGECICIYQL